MIEKTRKKQQRPCMQKNCIQRMLPVLLFNFLLFFTTTLSAQVCAPPTSHASIFDIASDCAIQRNVTDGNAYNLSVDPNVTYSFTVCDPNYTTGGSQPYLELWDAPNGNFLALSTATNGCATVTHSNCTPIQDYSLFVHTQHGTSMCDVDNANYEFTSTCTPNTFTCPTTATPFKISVSGASCCYSGLIPLPDLSTIGCQNAATLAIAYTDCSGIIMTNNIPLPDADNAVLAELPLGVNNVDYTVTVNGVAVTCTSIITVTKSIACNANMVVALGADCKTTIDPSTLSSQTCMGVDYDVTYTVNGVAVDTLRSEHLSSINIVATVTDPHGNNCSSNIDLQDNLGPKLVCPVDVVLTCGQSTDIANTGGMATATDCSGIDGEVTFLDSRSQVGCGEEIIRTFYATDKNGVTASCQQTITLQPINLMDVEPPSNYIDATATGPNEMVLSCTDFPITSLPGVEDVGGLTINGILLSTGMNCQYLVSKSDEVVEICGGAYDLIRTWSISDWCNTPPSTTNYVQYIKVKDSEGPVGTAGTASFENEMLSCESTVEVGAASFTDSCSPIVATNYTVSLTGSGTTFSSAINAASGTFNNVPMGVYNVEWCAQDECGNEGCVTSALTIVDDSSPLAVCGPKTISINNSSSISFCATAFDGGSTDNCGIAAYKVKRMDAASTVDFTDCVSLSCSDTDAPVALRLRVYDVLGTYVASDDIPEAATGVRFTECMSTVTVDDKTCPTCPAFPDVAITCNQQITDGVGYVVDPSIEGTGAGELNENTDNCNMFAYADGGLTDSNGAVITELPTCGGVIYKNWILTASNNADCAAQTCQQRINISATTWDGNAIVNGVPNIAWPVDVTVDCDALTTATTEPVLSNIDDACGFVFTSLANEKIHNSINGGCQRILRTWKVVDECATDPLDPTAGVYTQDQEITVNDNIDPVLPALSDLTVECNTTFPLPDLPVATDNCDDSVTVTSDQNTIFGAPDASGNYSAAVGTYTVTYTATDNCNNTVSESITVTIGDFTGPVVTCLVDNNPIDLGPDCTELVTASAIASAADVCDGADLTVFVERITDPANPSTTLPTTTNVTFTSSDITTGTSGTFYVQAWAVDAAGNSSSIVCSIALSGPDACFCGTGFTFDVNENSSEPNCDLEATVSNLLFDGAAIDAADYSVMWESNATCNNLLTCAYPAAGTYTVTVSHNSRQCSNAMSVTITQDIVEIIDQTSDNCNTGLGIGSVLLNSVNVNASISNIELLNAAGNNLQDGNGDVVCDNLSIGEFCSGQSSGDYIARVTFANGCVYDKLIEHNCSFLRIGGIILNEEGDELDEVTVKVSDAVTPVITDESGAYIFETLTEGSNYTVTPTKNVDPLNGVTTFDLVLISQHILGVELLDTPYKLIAADANNSGTITTLDLVKIQRLILGLDNDFAPIDSWCFVDGSFAFPTPTNPFQTTFPEIYPINNFTEEMLDVDFVGVKIGDVNGTAIANNLLPSETRSEGTLNFEIQNQQYERGEAVEVNFTSDAFDSMLGFQFTYQFDNDALEFVEVKSNTLENLTYENFGLKKVANGLITASWFSHKAISLESEDVLFTLVFKAKENGDLSNAFDITSGITKNEIYSTINGSISTLSIHLNVDGAIDNSKEVTLFQNSPNPFQESTTIQFYLPEADQASILIFDYSGKLVTEINRDFEKGMNEILINKETLNTSGVLFYQLETKQFTATKKMLIVD